MTDVGEPYDDINVEQVFAVVGQREGFSAGSWVRSHVANQKVVDDVERYSIDPITKEDHVEKLMGNAALTWERQICSSANLLVQLSIGQDSKACRSVLRTTFSGRAVNK